MSEISAKSLSVIIPFWNAADYLDSSISSVLDMMPLCDLELVLVNDGSTDESTSIARDYAERFDFITLLEQDNKGVASARNVGIASAVNEYLTFLDSDDDMLPARITSGLAQATQETPVVMGTMRMWIKPGLEVPLHVSKVTSIPESEQFHPILSVVHRSIYDRGFLFDESYRLAEDTDWHLRLEENRITTLRIPKAFALRRIHGKNLTFDPKATASSMRRALLEHTKRISKQQ